MTDIFDEINKLAQEGAFADEEATNARGIREAPAITALRRRPRLSNLIDKADDLRKRAKGE